MAEIFMRYIMIKNDANKEEFELIDKVRQFFKENYDIDQLEGIINIKKGELNYCIKQNNDVTRCFVSLVSRGHIRTVSKCIEDVICKLESSELKKYFFPLKAYDGLSKYYCEKLYPKYSEYERKLRYMVLLVVTKAYGKGWIANTIKGKIEKNVSAKARNSINRIHMNDILEYFDLNDLENYLFAPPEMDVVQFVENELTPEKLSALNKGQICLLIENIRRPSCLWERIFTDVGTAEEWKNLTKTVHGIRNCVAHNKKISKKQYDDTLKILTKINNRLDVAIDTVITQELEETKKIDILGTFAAITEKLKLDQSEYIGMNILLKEFGRKTSELIKPIEKKLHPEIVDEIKKSVNLDAIKLYDEKYRKSIQKFANNFVLPDNWENRSGMIKELKDGVELGQEQINAIRIAAKFEKLEAWFDTEEEDF